MRWTGLRLCLAFSLFLAAAAPLWAAGNAPAATAEAVCDDIVAAARRYKLPVPFFTRLIWQESRFRRFAVSPAGAEGVAQFMPLTASDRGLVDPFAQHDAILASAGYLDELRTTYGNLGLAAAAYNAGPARLARWLAGQGALPQETRDYVLAVTGHEVSDWSAGKTADLAEEPAFACAHFAEIAKTAPAQRASADEPGVSSKPWSVILIGNPSHDKAVSQYRLVQDRFSGILGGAHPAVVRRRISGAMTPRYIVQIERDTRAEADSLCGKLLRAGGNCFVLASRS